MARVETIAGTGTAGYSESQVNNPYGLTIGPDGGLYFCEVGNQRIRRLDRATGTITLVAGNGEKGHTGDGGPAIQAALNMPHELCFDRAGDLYIDERDNHAVRKVDRSDRNHFDRGRYWATRLYWRRRPGRSGPTRSSAQYRLRREWRSADLRHRQSPDTSFRSRNGPTGHVRWNGGTRATAGTSSLSGAPLNGPRTIVVGDDGSLYLALREGNAIYRIDPATRQIEHLAGTGEQGYSGDGGPARSAMLAGPKGLAFGRDGRLFVADTENHVIRAIDLGTGVITTVLGTGQRGDGPETDPLDCQLARPHGLCVDDQGTLYISDSEAHRIRMLR